MFAWAVYAPVVEGGAVGGRSGLGRRGMAVTDGRWSLRGDLRSRFGGRMRLCVQTCTLTALSRCVNCAWIVLENRLMVRALVWMALASRAVFQVARQR